MQVRVSVLVGACLAGDASLWSMLQCCRPEHVTGLESRIQDDRFVLG